MVTIPLITESPSMMIASPLVPVRLPSITRFVMRASVAVRIPTVRRPTYPSCAVKNPTVAIPLTTMLSTVMLLSLVPPPGSRVTPPMVPTPVTSRSSSLV